MSTQEKMGSGNWLITYCHRVFGHAVKKTKDFALLNLDILRSPTSAEIISDDGPAGLPRAIKYFLKSFGLTFAILLIANRFQLFEGRSEWRELTVLIAQFLVTIITIYALCLILTDRIPFFRLVQAALYTVGAYLLVNAVANIPLAYFEFAHIHPALSRELDVIATEDERCLADNSILYWLLRGDLKFYLFSDVWRPRDWQNWFLQNWFYLLAIPFVFIFALMLRPVRKISLVAICIVAITIFVAVDKGIGFARRQSASLLMARDKCTFDVLIDRITSKYAPDLIARQLAYKISNTEAKMKNQNEFLKSQRFSISFSVIGTSLVLQVNLPSDKNIWRAIAHTSPALRNVYCQDNDPYWVALRRINYNLLVAQYDNDNTLLDQQQFTPKDCPEWPAPGVSK